MRLVGSIGEICEIETHRLRYCKMRQHWGFASAPSREQEGKKLQAEHLKLASQKDRLPTFCSPIRWAGSKRRLVPLLKEFWRKTDSKYIEAFAGSACLFFDIRPAVAVINDTNSELISAYQVLSRQPYLLHHHLTELPSKKDFYYRLRANSITDDQFFAAVRFFYLNRNCFNGIYRTNKSGAFNVPFASSRAGTIPPLKKWVDAASLLAQATLSSCDFDEMVRRHVQPNAFVYLDPPYAVSNRRVFTQYSANEFGIDDLLRLRSLMDHIDEIGATFVVSYALSKETAILSDGWYSAKTLTQRNVAGFSHHRRKSVEVIITNDRSRLEAVRGRVSAP